MATKKLQRYVTVNGVTYGPDDKVPAEVMDAISNPKAFEPDGGDAAAAPPASADPDDIGGAAGGETGGADDPGKATSRRGRSAAGAEG